MQELIYTKEFRKPIDYLAYQLRYQYQDLSENELKMLVIIHLKGTDTETRKQIVKQGVFKSMQVVENELTKFRRKGILDGDKVILKSPLVTDANMKLTLNLKKV